MITCEHCREELAEYALGHSDQATSSAVSQHLATCVVCRRELAEIEAAWSTLALELPKAEPSADVFTAVMDRIERAEGPRPQGLAELPVRKPSVLSARQRWASYAVAATVAAALLAGALYMRPQRQTADAALHDLAARLGKLQQLERMLDTGSVRLASLKPPTADGPTAYVVWDVANKQWHFYALSLPAPPPGSAYQLWAVAEGAEPVAGPTIEIRAGGVGAEVADVSALAPQAAARAVVTLEPAGGSAAPTGQVVLEATL